jgi:Bacterial regulatory protein, arsR family
MSGMTGDERDRILGLLSAGPTTVARLAAGLGLPGGVVSYQLKLLEREGLARVGTIRNELGTTTAVWVSTAAAAPPPLRIPAALPGLTWTGDGPYPVPVWTAPRPPEPGENPSREDIAGPGSEAVPAEARHPGERAVGEHARPAAETGHAEDPATQDPATQDPATRAQIGQDQIGQDQIGRRPATRGPAGESAPARTDLPAGAGRHGADASGGQIGPGGSAPSPSTRAPQPRRGGQSDADSERGPRLLEVRRVPVDDATFYEFAARLDALAREFAARATPGAPLTELSISVTRPRGYGSGS